MPRRGFLAALLRLHSGLGGVYMGGVVGIDEGIILAGKIFCRRGCCVVDGDRRGLLLCLLHLGELLTRGEEDVVEYWEKSVDTPLEKGDTDG